MKIAITFLCLVIASFIDPSTQNIHLQDLSKDKVDCVVRFAYEMAWKVETLKTCPEFEKNVRKKCLVEDMLSGLRYLAIDLGCTLKDLLILINCPLDLIDSLSINNLEEIPVNIDVVMTSVMHLLEGVVAKAGIVLKPEVLKLDKLLGSLNGVLSIVSVLHDTLGAVINGLTGTFLGTVLGLVSAVPGLLDSIL
ncbi:hypothetical protein GDO81_007969 [Engystomops pustulosus]|uniref:Uncharacterized protein n=1 Tax=Engystomops pustulosus TaxID=76066 RepID=A0AAV7CBD2_ENGPU|nr:hypothetical protein GDO81_007969 [Engystomops pustulosus]